MKQPTIKQLVEWNKTGLRMLTPLRQRDEQKGALFADAFNQVIEAKPIGFPGYVRVTHREGNRDPFESVSPGPPLDTRPYYFHGDYLTPSELDIILGEDCHDCYFAFPVGSGQFKNAMWKAITDCPYDAANAYVLGNFYQDNALQIGQTIVPVQYYRIDQQRHQELGIGQDLLKSITKSFDWKNSRRRKK